MKKFLIIISLVIIVLITVGFFAFKYTSPKVLTLRDEIDACPVAYIGNSMNSAYINCITQLAIKYNDQTVCNHLPSSAVPDGPGYDCYVALLVANNDIDQCKGLRFPGDCLDRILAKTNSSS
jgi:hypothetical protein